MCCECRWPYFLVVLHIQVVLVSVLVTVGQGNDGDSVDRLHQSSLRKCLCHHLAAKVWHRIPDGQREKGRGVGEHIKGNIFTNQLQKRFRDYFMVKLNHFIAMHNDFTETGFH